MFKITKFDDDVIKFSNGWGIFCHHAPECCELNWADCSVLSNYPDIFKTEFDDFDIEPVDDIGFLLKLHRKNQFGIDIWKKILIPCYSEQNGYYSTNLDVYVDKGDETADYVIRCEERLY